MEVIRIKRTLLFLSFIFLTVPLRAEEHWLYNSQGNAVAYVADDLTIFSNNGDAMSYLFGSNNRFSIYMFNGSHIGWLINGIVCDEQGNTVGFEKGALQNNTMLEPGKGIKMDVPNKLTREFEPVPPVFTNQWANKDLEAFLRGEPQ